MAKTLTENQTNSVICERDLLVKFEIWVKLETATRGVHCNMVFLEISQNLQEITCIRVFF